MKALIAVLSIGLPIKAEYLGASSTGSGVDIGLVGSGICYVSNMVSDLRLDRFLEVRITLRTFEHSLDCGFQEPGKRSVTAEMLLPPEALGLVEVDRGSYFSHGSHKPWSG